SPEHQNGEGCGDMLQNPTARPGPAQAGGRFALGAEEAPERQPPDRRYGQWRRRAASARAFNEPRVRPGTDRRPRRGAAASEGEQPFREVATGVTAPSARG